MLPLSHRGMGSSHRGMVDPTIFGLEIITAGILLQQRLQLSHCDSGVGSRRCVLANLLK